MTNALVSDAMDPSPDACERSVRQALALQLTLEPERIAPEQRLREDLGLDSLDLSLVALRLERAVQRDFPLAVLDLLTTVDDLVRFVRAWATRR